MKLSGDDPFPKLTYLFGSAPRRGLFRVPGGPGREAGFLGQREEGLLELGLGLRCLGCVRPQRG